MSISSPEILSPRWATFKAQTKVPTASRHRMPSASTLFTGALPQKIPLSFSWTHPHTNFSGPMCGLYKKMYA